MTQKWNTLSSQTLIKDLWIDVRVDRCVTPSGVEISPYYVLAYPDWVHVVALTPERNLVLVRQYRHAVDEFVLELPGGGVDAADQSMEQAARRELAEETGYVSNTWLKLGGLYANPATHTNRIHAFLALDATAEHDPQLDQGEEGLELCVMPLDDVLAGLEDGILGQSMNVAAVLLATKHIPNL